MVWFWAVLPVLFCISSTATAAPEIRNVNIRGLQIGGTTTLVVEGTDLLPDPRLVMSLPIAKQIVRSNGRPDRVTIEVTLDGRPQPGLYNLWLANANGISGKVVVAVDRLPHRPFVNELEALPVSLHGTLSGSSKLRTIFHGKKDQEIVFEVEARRLGGKIRPVLHLHDADAKHLAWSMPSPTLRGDTRLSTTLPADGNYTLELHDLQYAAPTPNHFRLKIGTWQYADLVFPPAIERGKPASLELIGNVPSDKRIALTTSKLNLQTPAPWFDAALSSGLRPGLIVSDFPEVLEADTEDSLGQFPSIPSALSGRLSTPGEQDRHLLAVKPGSRLRFEVFAERIGSPLDVVLELQNEQGKRLATNDDVKGTADPRLDYSVPAGIEKIVVVIKDVNGRGGRRCIYRIAVTPLSASAAGDFQLSLERDRHSVSQGDRHVVKVSAVRRGYNGPIRVSFDDLPAGIQVQGGEIAAGADSTLLTLHGAGTSLSQALTSFRGTSVGLDPPLTRFASDRNHPVSRFQPWLGNEVAVALSKPAEIGFHVEWGRLPSETALVLGGTLQAPIKCTRPAGYDGPVRLYLITSQIAPLNDKGQPIPNRTLRRESTAVVEIPVDQQAQAAYNAKQAAEKALADAHSNAETIASAGEKAIRKATAKLKEALAKKMVLDKAAIAAKTKAETATAAKGAAQKNLADALARAKIRIATAAKAVAVAEANVKQAAEKKAAAKPSAKTAAEKALAEAERQAAASVTAAAKATAEVAVLVQQAATKKKAVDKTAADTAAEVKATDEALAAAIKALADAQTNAQTVASAAQTAKAQAAAKAEDAMNKLAAADKAAVVAAATAKNETEFNVLVPADLAGDGYELAFRAELLSRDKKNVLAGGFTPVRQIGTLNPIGLRLDGSPRIEARLTPETGATVKLAGNVERRAGLAGDVTVSLAGLPEGVAVPKVVVKADRNEFQLEIKFPPHFKPGQLNGIKVFATGKMNSKAPTVRSADVAVTINLLSSQE